MQAISRLRAAASHAYDDISIASPSGSAQISNADSNSIAFQRTPSQVCTPIALVRALQSGSEALNPLFPVADVLRTNCHRHI